MRLLKLALFGVMVAALMNAWTRRDFVVAAYTDEQESIEFQVNGLSTPELGESGPSPFVLASVSTNDIVTPPLPGASTVADPVVVVGGRAALNGVVVGTDGLPVEAAVVRIERITSAGSASVDVLTDVDGLFELTNVLGGRYRVRAFVPNLLRSIDVDLIQLPDGGTAGLDLVVAPAGDNVVIDLTTSSEILLGLDGLPGQTTIAVTAGRDVVDAQGVTVLVPIAGVGVDLDPFGALSVLSESPTTTDATGAARFLIECRLPGVFVVEAAVAEVRQSFTMPPCVEPIVEPVVEPAQEPAVAEPAASDTVGGQP